MVEAGVGPARHGLVGAAAAGCGRLWPSLRAPTPPPHYQHDRCSTDISYTYNYTLIHTQVQKAIAELVPDAKELKVRVQTQLVAPAVSLCGGSLRKPQMQMGAPK